MARRKKHIPRRKHVQTGTVTISLAAAVIGGICLVCFMIPTIICAVQGEWGTMAIFVLFDLLGLALLLTMNWRIDYNHEGFTYRNYFRISRHYTYGQITSIHQDRDSVIRIGRKRIHIDQMADNGRRFLSVAVQHAHSANYTTAKDAKLFRGNVRNPEEFIIIWVLMGAFMIGVAIMIIHGTPILHLEELESVGTTLSGLEEQCDEDDTPLLKLMQNEETYYILSHYDTRLADYDSLKADAEAGKTFRIYYETIETEDNVHRYALQIECGGTVYYSLEQVNNETYGIWALCGGMVVFWILFVAVSWYVMSHADKYPRLAAMFVKPEYLVHKNRK